MFFMLIVIVTTDRHASMFRHKHRTDTCLKLSSSSRKLLDSNRLRSEHVGKRFYMHRTGYQAIVFHDRTKTGYNICESPFSDHQVVRWRTQKAFLRLIIGWRTILLGSLVVPHHSV
jgi:hypothetical protein